VDREVVDQCHPGRETEGRRRRHQEQQYLGPPPASGHHAPFAVLAEFGNGTIPKRRGVGKFGVPRINRFAALDRSAAAG